MPKKPSNMTIKFTEDNGEWPPLAAMVVAEQMRSVALVTSDDGYAYEMPDLRTQPWTVWFSPLAAGRLIPVRGPYAFNVGVVWMGGPTIIEMLCDDIQRAYAAKRKVDIRSYVKNEQIHKMTACQYGC
jgi:hypothetical protein